MDVDQYAAARYGRLVEHAVRLGCGEDEARAQVDRVLVEQRRRIRRAEDPDPLVHEALERAVTGTGRRPGGVLAALGSVAVLVAIGGTMATMPAPEPVPSLFGMSGSQAQQLLERQGYDVQLRKTAFCEPTGLVLGSDPAVGRPAGHGATVVVQTAVPSDTTCHGQYADRSAAWGFVSFALGGRPPAFAPVVRLLVDTEQPRSLDHVESGRPVAWGPAFGLVAEAATRPAETETGMPALRVSAQLPPDEWCDTPRPDEVAGRQALRIEFDRQTRNDEGNCPLTIDLYRTGEAIDTVVVYRAKFERGELAFAGVR